MWLEILKAIVTVIIPLLFPLLLKLFPDFPLAIDTLTGLIIWIVIQLANLFLFKGAIVSYIKRKQLR